MIEGKERLVPLTGAVGAGIDNLAKSLLDPRDRASSSRQRASDSVAQGPEEGTRIAAASHFDFDGYPSQSTCCLGQSIQHECLSETPGSCHGNVPVGEEVPANRRHLLHSAVAFRSVISHSEPRQTK